MAGPVGGGTRGRVLAACVIGNAVSMTPAVHSVFGHFLVPLSASFGWQRASISAVLGIMAMTGAIVYPLAGRWADRHGARAMVLTGNILFAIGIALLALTRGSLTQFYATFLLISIGGSLASTPIFSKVIADWFDKGRGLALGLSAGGGNAVGSVVMPIVAALLISTQGWRAGYLGIAAIVVLLGLPTFLFLLRDAPRGTGARDDTGTDDDTGLMLADAARMPVFWLILLAIAVGAGCTTAIFSHVVPILADRGIDIATGTAVVSIFALVTSLWQIATGQLLDRVQRPRIVAPMYLMAVGGLALLEWGQGVPALIVGGALLGIGLGAQYGALPFYIARYFGLRAFGTIVGMMYSAVIVAQGVTPVLLDAGYDAMGSYGTAVIATCGALAAGAFLLLFLPAYPRDIRIGAVPGEARAG
jgi:MFS family permease